MVAEDAKRKDCCESGPEVNYDSAPTGTPFSFRATVADSTPPDTNLPINMREIVHLQAGQCGNQIGAKVRHSVISTGYI